MVVYNQNSPAITIFHGFPALVNETTFAGYAALIAGHALRVPLPDSLCAIGANPHLDPNARWRFFSARHRPEDTLIGHLTFALKHEGVDLGLLKALFQQLGPVPVEDMVRAAPTGAYSRRVWFLYEWLCEKPLDLPDANRGNYVPLLQEKLQYPGPSRDSRRHRVRNNLPGTREFCPLIRRTETLERFREQQLAQAAARQIGETHADLLSRAAAFLLLKDSKASYVIEGESPPHTRIARWGRILGEAGLRELSLAELEYLQGIIIVDQRFTLPGIRVSGGFVGEHDRLTGMPLPDHLSARPEDLESLMRGLLDTHRLLIGTVDPVLAATAVAFGFVFIHPFEDGNGRLHRYLIHHVLAEHGFAPKGLVFPVSAVILERIEAYREVLEWFSKPRLDLIDWRPTEHGNVEIMSDSADLYRYFDATRQAEFLFGCVEKTVRETLPEEVSYLAKQDWMKDFINHLLDMPDRQVNLLIGFLRQGHGTLSKRAREKEFRLLTEAEIEAIEHRYQTIFEPFAH